MTPPLSTPISTVRRRQGQVFWRCWQSLARIYRLGCKELWSLWRDPVMLLLILYSFSLNIYVAGTAMPETLHQAPLAIVDLDQSALSQRLRDAFYPPHFLKPELISQAEADLALDRGQYTFVLTIPPDFQQQLLAGRAQHSAPKIQLSIDATRMSQAFSGNLYIDRIVNQEAQRFLAGFSSNSVPTVDLALRARFNPTLNGSWFGSLMEVINAVTLISIVLTGAALIREREHGTIEHLLVMPVSPAEIMLAKIWSMALVVLTTTVLSLYGVIEYVLQVQVAGSVPLFALCALVHLFATTSLGIFMATVTKSMPQFGLLLIMTLLPLQMLSGGVTPRESMPEFIQQLMLLAPTTHFVAAAQGILYRGADFSLVWQPLCWMLLIGVVLFMLSLQRFRQSLTAV